jgi:UDP-3-O-[3-hydroxymyristoyl] glucosamine N-acyltransferase
MPTIRDMITFLKAEKSNRILDPAAEDFFIQGPAPFSKSKAGDVTFCGPTLKNSEALLSRVRGSLLIVGKNFQMDFEGLSANGVKAVIYSENPRLDFIRLIKRFFACPSSQGVHPSAVISPKAILGRDIYIGPLCSLGEVEIGDHSVIHAGVHIYDGVRIGRRVTIHSGTVIGADGFGYERDESGRLEKFPHLGGVIIEDDVEIGANTCIDRGVLEDTRVCMGARIDNLVHLAHNVHVGKHAVVIANAMVGGSTRIEDYAWISPSACLRDRITVGAEAIVGLAALVTEDVHKGNTVLGAPARELSKFKKLLAHWNSITQRGKDKP